MSETLKFDAGINLGRLYSDATKMEQRVGAAGKKVEGVGAKMGKGFSTGFSSFMTPQALGLAGISALLAKVAKDSLEFSENFKSGMLEVQTISTETQDDLRGMSEAVMDISVDGVKDDAVQLSEALYQIVSAGYDGADGLKLLEISAKAATGGVTETKIAADGITTVMNAWGASMDDATKISDLMFKTVEKGKTDMGLLSSNIAKVAPLASAMGVGMNEIFAATASITKQGTPTAEAFTQMRAALTAMNGVLGDGWSKTMTFQEGLAQVREMSNGSNNELKKLLGTDEAVLATLALTGDMAAEAASDLEAMGNSAGAASAAFKIMQDDSAVQRQNLQNNINKFLSGFGDGLADGINEIRKSLNEAFEEGKITEFFENLGTAIKFGAAMMVVFNASSLATTASMVAQEIALKALIVREQVLNRWTKITAVTQAAYNTTTSATSGIIAVLSTAMKALWVTMASNPLTAVIAVLGIAVGAFIAFRKTVKDAAEVQEDFNALQKQSEKIQGVDEMISRYDELASKQSLTNEEQAEYNQLIEDLASTYPDAIGQIDEHGKVLGLNTEKLKEYNDQQKDALKLVAEEQLKDAEKSLEKFEQKLRSAQSKTSETYTAILGNGTRVETTRSGSQRAKAASQVLEYSEQVAQIQNTIKGLKGTLGLEVDIVPVIDDKTKIEQPKPIEVEVKPIVKPKTINDLEKELKELEGLKGSFGDSDKEVENLKNIKSKTEEITAEWQKIRDKQAASLNIDGLTTEIKGRDATKIKGGLVDPKSKLASIKKMSAEEVKQLEIIKKKLDAEQKIELSREAQIETLEETSEAMFDVADVTGSVSNLMGAMGSDSADTVGFMADMVGQAGNLTAALASGDYVAAITSAIGLISTVVEEQRNSEAKAVESQLAINEILTARYSILADLGMITELESANSELEGLVENADLLIESLGLIKLGFTKDTALGEVDRVRYFKDLMNNVYGKDWDIVDLTAVMETDASFEEFIDKYEKISGLDFFGADEEELQSQFNAYLEALNKIEEQYNDIANVALGFTSDDLVNTIVDGVSQGFTLAGGELGGFMDGFEEHLETAAKTALTNSFEKEFIEDLMKKYEAAFADGTLTESEKTELADEYAEAVRQAQENAKNFASIFGTDINEPVDDPLKGSVQSITEKTAGKMEGQLSSIQYNTANIKNIIDEQLISLQKIAHNTGYNHHLEDVAADVGKLELSQKETNKLLNTIITNNGDFTLS